MIGSELRSMTNLAVAALLTLTSASAQNTWENLNAVVWVQTSAEYRAATLQTYRAAEMNLIRALSDKTWTAATEQTESDYSAKPPAIILDLDETVLDNSAWQAHLAETHASYTDARWAEWVAKARAGLVPGAADFLATAHGHGVAIFYVTNRVCDPKKVDDPTIAVLRAHNLPLRSDRLLCKAEGTDKSPRRAYVARGHRVLLLIGDDLNDFLTAGASIDARQTAARTYDRYWGERWFMLPNPTYGSWERAAGYKLEEKVQRLRK